MAKCVCCCMCFCVYCLLLSLCLEWLKTEKKVEKIQFVVCAGMDYHSFRVQPNVLLTFDCINIFSSTCLERQILPCTFRKVTERTVKMLELAWGEQVKWRGFFPKTHSFLPLLVFVLMSCQLKCKIWWAVPERYYFFDQECREQTPVVSIASTQLYFALCCTSDP